MATLNWSQVVFVSVDSAKQTLLNQLDAIGFTATAWEEGSIPLLMVELSAFVWSQATSVAVFLKESALNETATGEALTRYSLSNYDNTRAPATSTQRTLTLTVASGSGPYPITLGSLIAEDVNGVTFRNVAGAGVVYPFSLTSAASQAFLFEAEIAGTTGNAAAGSVTQLQTTLAGVTVTSDVIAVLGVDEESDVRLRARNSSKWARLSEFEVILDAIDNIALDASSGVAQIAVDDGNPRGVGTFDVYIAGIDGTAGTSDVLAVQDAFNQRILGQNAFPPRCQVYAAPTRALAITGTVYYSGASGADVQAAVEGNGTSINGALHDFIEAVPLGGFDFSPGPSRVVPKNDIEAAIKATVVNGLVGVVKTVVLTIPTGDVATGAFDKVIAPASWSISYVQING